MITNEILVKNALSIKTNTLEDYTVDIMNMLGVDIDYESMFNQKNKIIDKSTGKVVCERKMVPNDTFIKLKSKYSDGYKMPYEIYIFDEVIIGAIYSNKGGVVFKSYKNSKSVASFYDSVNFDIARISPKVDWIEFIISGKAEGIEVLRKEEAQNIEELDLANIIDLIKPSSKSKILRMKNRLTKNK